GQDQSGADDGQPLGPEHAIRGGGRHLLRKPSDMRRRVRQEERGLPLIVVLGAIMVISIFVAVAFAAAVHSNTATYQERTGKQAFAAALAGLRTGVYRLNTSGVATDKCPTYTVGGSSTTNPTNGLCGAYSSTDTG